MTAGRGEMEGGPNRTSTGPRKQRALSEETVPLALQYATFLFTCGFSLTFTCSYLLT